MKHKFVSWRRVSTKKQGASGLGLQAQKEIIRYFIEREEGEWIADYEECYTGTDLDGCTELRKAMEHAKREDAILIIAKTDRFRNTIEALQVYEKMGDGNIMFCDLPHTDKFTLTLFFALAEREALIVSIRTKQALDAKKARGEKTGGASEKWIENYKNKTRQQIKEESMKRGEMKNKRHIESRDIQALIRVLKNVFTEAAIGDDITAWDWSKIGTRQGQREKVLATMKDYKELDPTLFAKWDFSDLESHALRMKLAGQISNLHKSVRRYARNSSNNNN